LVLKSCWRTNYTSSPLRFHLLQIRDLPPITKRSKTYYPTP
jgi:hypothetical protein